GERRVHLVGKAGIDRPGEIRLAVVLAISDASVGHVDVLVAHDGQRGEADAAAYIGRDAPPGAEIDIGVGEAEPALDIGGIFVGAAASADGKVTASTGIFVMEEEGSVAAIFSGQVEAEIMAGIVAEADTEQ